MLQVMPSSFGNNPFAVLTLIAAPAVFTNASSILALGTANRLARTIDRTRDLGNLIANEKLSNEKRRMHAEHIRSMEARTTLLVRAMQAFYTSVGAFAAASLISLLGAGLTYTDYRYAVQFTIFVGLAAGCVGFCGLVTGGMMLVRETRMAVVCLREEAEFMLRSFSDER
jgi:hypothetical protein